MRSSTRKLVRLDRTEQSGGRRVVVERGPPGSVRGLSVITTGEALGHGFYVDELTVKQVASALAGVPGRWTHGSMSADGLARHLGNWGPGRVESFAVCRSCVLEDAVGSKCPGCEKPLETAHRVVADFNFSQSAYRIRPSGLDVPAPVYLMDRAEEDPTSFGVSISALLDMEERDELDPKGKKVGTKLFGRLAQAPRALRRADFVADPAANPVGLHAGTGAVSELTEEATHQLDRVVERLGRDEAKSRALGFLHRYFASGDAKETSMDHDELAADAEKTPEKDAEGEGDEGEEKETAEATCPECGQAMPGEGDGEDEGDEDASAKPAPRNAEASAELSAKVKELEEARAADRVKHANTVVELARKWSARTGVLLGEDDSNEIREALSSGDARLEKFAHKMLDAHFARADAALTRGVRTVTPKAPEKKKQDEEAVESDKVVAEMSESRGIKFRPENRAEK